jgi:tRNA threonylcarbamoyladenosine biosynthesis protein TsaE
MFAHYLTSSPEETIELGKRLAQRLVGGDTVLFFGELGSGKTHFIKGLAQGLGILMTIKSPTYAYVNKYPTPNCGQNGGQNRGKVFYHYDLYRMNEADDFASIGLEESLSDPEAINAVEWADRLGGTLPKRCVLVYLSESGTRREIRIEFLSPTLLDEASIESYYEEWATPPNVRRHCRMVTHVAMSIAEAYMRKGEIINTNLLYVSGMLHDMARLCDFNHFDRANLKEPVSDEQWKKMLKIREAHQGKRHAEISFDQLKERGYEDTAEIIRVHEADNLVLEPKAYDTLEKKILYYADKRVTHDRVVSIKERFKDGRERYGEGDTPAQKKLYLDVELYSLELEKELFKGLDIKPKDIRPISL